MIRSWIPETILRVVSQVKIAHRKLPRSQDDPCNKALLIDVYALNKCIMRLYNAYITHICINKTGTHMTRVVLTRPVTTNFSGSLVLTK